MTSLQPCRGLLFNTTKVLFSTRDTLNVCIDAWRTAWHPPGGSASRGASLNLFLFSSPTLNCQNKRPEPRKNKSCRAVTLCCSKGNHHAQNPYSLLHYTIFSDRTPLMIIGNQSLEKSRGKHIYDRHFFSILKIIFIEEPGKCTVIFLQSHQEDWKRFSSRVRCSPITFVPQPNHFPPLLCRSDGCTCCPLQPLEHTVKLQQLILLQTTRHNLKSSTRSQQRFRERGAGSATPETRDILPTD